MNLERLTAASAIRGNFVKHDGEKLEKDHRKEPVEEVNCAKGLRGVSKRGNAGGNETVLVSKGEAKKIRRADATKTQPAFSIVWAEALERK